MKLVFPSIISVLLLSAPAPACGQGTFQNLGFESVIPPLNPDLNFSVPITNALPGWTGYIGGNPVNRVMFNNTGLDAPSISLFDAQNPFSLQPIQGNYSVFLKFSAAPNQPTISAAIGQTGQIPNDALSLRFLVAPFGGVLVSFGGQNIPLAQSGSSGNNIIMAGDISMFAGQTGELRFLANGTLFDDIRFSNQPIPEPGTISLLLVGLALIGFRCWRTSGVTTRSRVLNK